MRKHYWNEGNKVYVNNFNNSLVIGLSVSDIKPFLGRRVAVMIYDTWCPRAYIGKVVYVGLDGGMHLKIHQADLGLLQTAPKPVKQPVMPKAVTSQIKNRYDFDGSGYVSFLLYKGSVRDGVSWRALNKSVDRYETVYNEETYQYDRKLKAKGDGKYLVIPSSTTICYASFSRDYKEFRDNHKTKPDTIIIKIPLNKEKGVPVEVLKKYITILAQSKVLPSYMNVKEIFKDANNDNCSHVYFKIDLSSISKEKFFWYASALRNIWEHPHIVDLTMLIHRETGSHPLVAYCVAHAAHPAFTGGHSGLESWAMRAENMNTKRVDIPRAIQHILRVTKFLTKSELPVIPKEKKDFPMWRLNDHLKCKVKVRFTPSFKITFENLFAFNPFTRKIEP